MPAPIAPADEQSDSHASLTDLFGVGADLDGIFMVSESGRHDCDPNVGDTPSGYLDSVLKVAVLVEGTVAVGAFEGVLR